MTLDGSPSMAMKTDIVKLTESEGMCLRVLRNYPASKSKTAVAAKLDLKSTAVALKSLEALGLIERDETKSWRVTQRGAEIVFETNPARKRRSREKLGPGARRLLNALDSPMHAADLAKRLDITKQRVHQLAVSLHALGLVRFGDHGTRFSLIARKDDPTELLSKDEERLLSAVSGDYPTSSNKMRSAVRFTAARARDALVRLIALGLIEEVTGPCGEVLFGITQAGRAHPQRNELIRRAEPPHLPVNSDRVIAVLSSISDDGQARIRDVAQTLQLPRATANALFQYLKRRSLVRKCAKKFNAPYELTAEGCRVLAELTQRRAA